MVAGTLPEAQIKYGALPEGDFVTRRDVPVFAEHETVTKDGRPLKFGQVELQAVADRCNRRIEQTGDYAAITLGHTPDPNSPNQQQPEVVGFAGPFKVGVVGAPGQRTRYAILADFHIYKEDAAKIKKYPRRSPELFVEDTYQEMFLDPVALLSAEAPRLDMGLLYSAQRDGRTIHKYTAVAPGPGNVFVQSDDALKNKCKDYAAEPSADISSEKAKNILEDGEVHGHPLTEKQKGMFGAAAGKKDYAAHQAETPQQEATSIMDPGELQQIVEAIMQTDVMQWAAAEMQKAATNNATVPPVDQPPPAPAAPVPAGSPPGAPVSPPAPEAGPPPAGPPPAPPGPPKPEDKEKDYTTIGPAQRRYEADDAPTGEYQTADQGDLGGRKVEHTLGTPVDQDNASGKHYAADGSNDPDIKQPAKDPTVMGDKGVATGSSDEDSNVAAGTYQTANQGNLGGRTVEHTEGTPVQQGNASGDSTKYRLLENKLTLAEREIDVLKEKYHKEEERRIDSERLAALESKRMRFTFDVEKQFERCRYSKMSNEQFAQHVEMIDENFRPIPIDEQLPIGWADEAASHAPHKPGNTREKYSKEQSRKALDWCSRRAEKDLPQDYETALNSFAEHDRPPTDAELA